MFDVFQVVTNQQYVLLHDTGCWWKVRVQVRVRTRSTLLYVRFHQFGTLSLFTVRPHEPVPSSFLPVTSTRIALRPLTLRRQPHVLRRSASAPSLSMRRIRRLSERRWWTTFRRQSRILSTDEPCCGQPARYAARSCIDALQWQESIWRGSELHYAATEPHAVHAWETLNLVRPTRVSAFQISGISKQAKISTQHTKNTFYHIMYGIHAHAHLISIQSHRWRVDDVIHWGDSCIDEFIPSGCSSASWVNVGTLEQPLLRFMICCYLLYSVLHIYLFAIERIS